MYNNDKDYFVFSNLKNVQEKNNDFSLYFHKCC